MIKHKNLNAAITTGGGNHYYAGRSVPQVILMHPVLKYLVELKAKGKLEEWLGDLQSDESGKIKLEDGVYASIKDISFYGKYLQFLDEKGYFDGVEKYPMTPALYSGDDVKRAMANTQQIVFEVTEACNLHCKYCGYGELYSASENRKNQNLDFDVAGKILDYMIDLFESPLNRNHHKKIALSFYGGEPLLNMPFIKETVRRASRRKLTNKMFYFTMTTNGTLLDKHMDFLAANDFLVSVSLDGDVKHNGHRIFPDGRSSFETVYHNILKLREKYPDYFRKSVNFISVMHNKNSNKEVREFFKREFQKGTRFIQLNPLGVKPKKSAEYEKLFNAVYSDLTPEDIIADSKRKDRILKAPFIKILWNFLGQYSGFVFRKYDSLIHKKARAWQVSTGTCSPFEKKVFITTSGMLLPCERILQSFSLGRVDKEGVRLDFDEVAEKYNGYFRKLMHRCNRCVNSSACPHCIFTLNIDEESPTCDDIMNEREFKENLTAHLSMLEETPQYYLEIMKNYEVN